MLQIGGTGKSGTYDLVSSAREGADGAHSLPRFFSFLTENSCSTKIYLCQLIFLLESPNVRPKFEVLGPTSSHQKTHNKIDMYYLSTGLDSTLSVESVIFSEFVWIIRPSVCNWVYV